MPRKKIEKKGYQTASFRNLIKKMTVISADEEAKKFFLNEAEAERQ